MALSPKNPENEGEEEADDDAGRKGKVEGEGVLLHIDITGKAAYVRDFLGKKEKDAHCDDDDSEDDEHPAERSHVRIS